MKNDQDMKRLLALFESDEHDADAPNTDGELRLGYEAWDWKERTPIGKITKVMKLVGGEQIVTDNIDTGGDYYAAVISNREISGAEALKFLRHAMMASETEVEVGSSVDEICARLRSQALQHEPDLTDEDFGE